MTDIVERLRGDAEVARLRKAARQTAHLVAASACVLPQLPTW